MHLQRPYIQTRSRSEVLRLRSSHLRTWRSDSSPTPAFSLYAGLATAEGCLYLVKVVGIPVLSLPAPLCWDRWLQETGAALKSFLSTRHLHPGDRHCFWRALRGAPSRRDSLPDSKDSAPMGQALSGSPCNFQAPRASMGVSGSLRRWGTSF